MAKSATQAAPATKGDLPVQRAHKPGCGVPVRASRSGKKRALVLIVVHLLVAAHIVHWKTTGSTLTPVEPSEAGDTLELGYVNAGFLLFAVLILATIVFGRFFCGWACHLVAYQDACAWLLGKLGLKPKPVRSRLLMLVPFVAVVRMFLWPTFSRWWSGGPFLPDMTWHLTTDSLWERFPGPWMTIVTFVVCGFLIIWVLGAKAFCTYGCPYGAVFGVADRFTPGKIRVTDACEGCGHCTQVCTSNVRVHEEVALHGMVIDPGCMKCRDCVSVCPKDALYFGFGKTQLKYASDKARKQEKKRRRKLYDFTWPEELVMAAVCLGAYKAFIGLYGAVPFLLSLALAVLTAIATVCFWRLVRRGDMTLQSYRLKAQGKLTGAGFAALAVCPVYLAFTGHSGFIQINARRGNALLEQYRDLDTPTDDRDALLVRAVPYLERVERYSLFETVEVQNKLGQVLARLGRDAQAEEHLLRAAQLDDDQESSRVYLCRLYMAQGRFDEALELCDQLVTIDPINVYVAGYLQRLLQSPRHAERARLIADRLAAARRELEHGH